MGTVRFIRLLLLSDVSSAGLIPSSHYFISGSACNLNSSQAHYIISVGLSSSLSTCGQTSHFSSCHHSDYRFSIGFLQRVSTAKVLSVAVTPQLTELWYLRRSELDFNNHDQSRGLEQGPSRHLRFDHACAGVFGQNNLQSRGFVDGEDLFIRDLDAFDNLEARRWDIGFGSAGSVFFIYL
jgi:hypothetical protein